jgi:HTH-type transcriptional regulator, competence development regulator
MASAHDTKYRLTYQAASLSMLPMGLDLLGNSLKDARGALGWSLRVAEEKTGVSNAYLSQLESAKIKQPSPKVLHKLAEAYGLSYALVMEYAGYPIPAEAQLSGPEQRFMSRIGRTTGSEQEKLVEYLCFLRSRKR